MNNAWLAHHGILGQKWGVRRFQNADGTYTDAGKKRYRSDEEMSEKEKNARIKEERKILDKSRSSMSDKDLDETINRLKKENELHKLVNPGQTYVDAIMSDVGKRVLTTAAAGAALFAAKAFIDSIAEDTNDPVLKGLADAVFNGGAKKKK